MSPKTLTRRDFLKILTASMGGMLAVSCSDALGGSPNTVRIMVDSWALSYAPFKAMADAFNKIHPETPVKVEASPGGWMTKVVGQMRSNKLQWSGAGVMSTFNDLASWIQLGLIQPVDDYITASQEPGASTFINDLLPVVKEDNAYEGKFYGFPFSLENITYQWNTETFGKAGVANAPKTLQELYDYSLAVKEYLNSQASKDSFAFGFDMGHLNRNLGAVFFSMTDQPYTEDGWFRWDSDEMRAALSYMRKLSRAGITPPNCGEGLEIVDMWTRGRLAGLYSPSSRGVWAQKSIGFDKVVTSQTPTIDGKPHSGSNYWCNSISIFNKAPLPQQAVDFLIFAIGPQNQDWQKAIIQAGTSPVFGSVYSDLLASDSSLAPYIWMQELRDRVAVSAPSPKNYYYQIQNEAWNQHWASYLKDSSTLSEDDLIQNVLKTAQEIHQQALQSIPTLTVP